MAHENPARVDHHTRVILDYYDSKEEIEFTPTPYNLLVARYLSKVMKPDEFSGKIILEIGAGCSRYTGLFLEGGCARYYANDLIAERMAANRVGDPRYVEIPGDLRYIQVPEQVDIVFANLTMMYLVPMLDECVLAIKRQLKPGGLFLSMDANFFCPLTLFRRVRESRNAIPTRLFSPIRYAGRFREAGFVVEQLVPFTPPCPWTTGNWLLGTAFWLRARKQSCISSGLSK